MMRESIICINKVTAMTDTFITTQIASLHLGGCTLCGLLE